MNIASGLIISSLFRQVRDSVIFDFKDKFWGKVKRENVADSPTAEFRATKLVKVWDKTLQCGVLLEIEPLIADPRPTEFQKEFFLHISTTFCDY